MTETRELAMGGWEMGTASVPVNFYILVTSVSFALHP